MKIVIDMQGAQASSQLRGIGRYTLSLAKAIIRNCGTHEILLAVNGCFPESIVELRAAVNGLLPQKNICVWYPTQAFSLQNNIPDWHEHASQLLREAFLASLKPDIILISSLFEGFNDDAVTSVNRLNTSIPTAVILYDLIPLFYPEIYLNNPYVKAWYTEKINNLRRSDRLLAISESSRQEAITLMGLSPDVCVTISGAIDRQFYQKQSIHHEEEQAIRARFGLSRSFIMYTGGIDYRKNVDGLIKAYARLPRALRKTHQLAVVCFVEPAHRTSLTKLAKKRGLKADELVLTGFVTDDELLKLYNLCKLFVFPSWHEGFGLPILEAMSCGRAVIAANTSSMPEVISNTEALFDPLNEDSIADKLMQVLTDDDFRKQLEQHSLKQAEFFCWDTTACRTLAALEAIKIEQQPVSTSLSTLIDTIAQIQPSPIDEQPWLATAQAIACSIPQSLPSRQLLIDISELIRHDAKTGIQRVVRNILELLLRDVPKNFRVEPVYASTEHGYRYARVFTSKLLGHSDADLVDDVIEYQSGDVFLGLDLQHHVVSTQQRVYQQWRNHGVMVYFIVYDLLPLTLPHVFPEGANKVHEEWLKIITQNDGAICISQSVAKELKQWLDANSISHKRPFTIDWFHLGADFKHKTTEQVILNKFDSVFEQINARPTFLMVGTLEPRKGHYQVLKAFELLWATQIDVNLVIVGRQGWMMETFLNCLRPHPELNKRLFWLEGINDAILEKVYASSTCLIVASEGEGFGLPLIEAAQHGIPIIARNLDIFKEVAGDNASYFDGLTPRVLADAIGMWLKRYDVGDVISSKGLSWLSWKESAKQLITVLLSHNER